VAFVTPEELTAGKDLTFDVEIPAEILHPTADGSPPSRPGGTVRLRPLTVKDVQLIAKAAKDNEVLTSTLMIQHAVVEPALKQHEVAELPGGVVSFLIDSINRVSGLTTSEDELHEIARSPIVRAFFILAKEFNWTPQQVRELTVGQLLGYLELLNETSGKQR
jgi:hypothetical protein